MAANRETQNAPAAFLLSLSKATLADVVYELAATHGECASCDDVPEVLRVISRKALEVQAPKRDLDWLQRAIEKTSPLKAKSRSATSERPDA